MAKVSVVIPSYNKADLTVRAVKSVLNQTYKDIECIVVDDCSTDDTLFKMERFKKDKRFRLSPMSKNNGASFCRNIARNLASGEYMAFLDCDDFYCRNKIEKSIGNFTHTAAWRGNNIYRPKCRNLLWKNYICNSTVIVKRSILDKVGYFDENLFCAADWDLWLRLEEVCKPKYINLPLTVYNE